MEDEPAVTFWCSALLLGCVLLGVLVAPGCAKRSEDPANDLWNDAYEEGYDNGWNERGNSEEDEERDQTDVAIQFLVKQNSNVFVDINEIDLEKLAVFNERTSVGYLKACEIAEFFPRLIVDGQRLEYDSDFRVYRYVINDVNLGSSPRARLYFGEQAKFTSMERGFHLFPGGATDEALESEPDLVNLFVQDGEWKRFNVGDEIQLYSDNTQTCVFCGEVYSSGLLQLESVDGEVVYLHEGCLAKLNEEREARGQGALSVLKKTGELTE